MNNKTFNWTRNRPKCIFNQEKLQLQIAISPSKSFLLYLFYINLILPLLCVVLYIVLCFLFGLKLRLFMPIFQWNN